MSTLSEIEQSQCEEVVAKVRSYRKNKKIKFLSGEFSDFTVNQVKKVLGRSGRVYSRLILLDDNKD